MKKIRKMSRMRKLLVSMLTLMLGVMMFTILQSNVAERGDKKVIEYDIEEFYSYRSTCGEKLTPQELARTTPFSMKQKVTIKVNYKNEVVSIRENLNKSRYKNDLQNLVKKVVSSKDGIFLYGQDGKLLKSDRKIDVTTFQLDDKRTNQLGFEKAIKFLTKEEITDVEKNGMKVSTVSKNKQEVSGKDFNLLINTLNNTKKMSLIDTDNDSFSSFNSYINIDNDKSILVRSVEESSSEIVKGKGLVMKKVKKISSYKVIDNGKVVTDYKLNNKR